MWTRSKDIKKVTRPVVGAIAATRAMLGFGLGLLASRRFSRKRGRNLGWVLLGVGLASTIPLAAIVLKRS
jgi:hypothetical protein